ncbi:MAG: hypothetical protein Q8K82_13390 [Gemmatimonadaceae bacterium]|nr:hypothetical protein [Gemmatimonadaceae bacterium]
MTGPPLAATRAYGQLATLSFELHDEAGLRVSAALARLAPARTGANPVVRVYFHEAPSGAGATPRAPEIAAGAASTEPAP